VISINNNLEQNDHFHKKVKRLLKQGAKVEDGAINLLEECVYYGMCEIIQYPTKKGWI